MFLTLAGPSDKVWVIDSAREEVYFLDEQIGFVVEMALDSEGRIWQTFVTEKTLLMIDTQNTLFDRSDDHRAEFGSSDGLVSTYAYGCVVDSDDNLYVANESGLVIYDGNGFTAMTNISSGELFDVEMDSEERVWIMARDGIHYYDPKLDILGGWTYYEIGVHIEFLTFSNELIQVQGFEFDPLNGCFWLAGETGLLKLAVQYDIVTQLDSIFIYPNPVLGNKGSLRIKHLPMDALVNIYGISGRLLIDNLQPDPVFGEVVWSIPDDIGSGLYFALVRSSNYGNKVCKFAIVR
jgi:ligand-binding sensor domain-containing protein